MCFYPICAWLALTCCCLIGLERIEAEERYQRRLDAYYGKGVVEQPLFVTVEHHPRRVVHVQHVEHVKPVVEKERVPETKEAGA
jgi:hypothetical protein